MGALPAYSTQPNRAFGTNIFSNQGNVGGDELRCAYSVWNFDFFLNAAGLSSAWLI